MAVVATGFFDGVHLGHRQVIQTLVSSARQRGEEAIVVTFAQHPRAVLQQDARILRLLNSPQEKEALLRALGVDRVETLFFDRSFARLTAEEYLRTVLCDRLGATLLVLGYDNRLGSDCLGPDALRPLAESLGLEVTIVPPTSAAKSAVSAVAPENRATLGFVRGRGPSPDGRGPATPDVFRGELPNCFAAEVVISSTKIRGCLERGDVEEAEAMLGYAYGLRGIVVSGKQLGRELGFPTANLRLYDPMKLVPAKGVYLTEVEVLGGHYWGMTNVGDVIETNIFDFNEDIYGLDLSIRFRRHLRAMRSFDSLDALSAQLAADRDTCRSLLASGSGSPAA
ncbi:MAG: bifunctional riboflavin kinase/FMN adenylyltransferase [Bacteroidales bacterium]|nr:bifunctional riboflavin kinase/FMN adenylyltransferase [Bacteroidales bacterium]